ncbi:olfactory receptor 1500-like [Bufo bufo]|uniref:olfactory receptor 1500-like n=1 Tax=Bufo bufo TaxID=8384 RepID=UPI001ABDD3E3|nr:olfactory receptor 1500-like [Bufo bufo]
MTVKSYDQLLQCISRRIERPLQKGNFSCRAANGDNKVSCCGRKSVIAALPVSNGNFNDLWYSPRYLTCLILTRARQLVECAFGISVAKWRILTKAMNLKVETIDDIVKACVVLHNYLLSEEPLCLDPQEVDCALTRLQHLGYRSNLAVARMRDSFADYFVSEAGRGNNYTAVTQFFLLGFQVSQELRISLFFLFLVVYCVTIFGNLLIITLVSMNKNLHTPMYFFISQLSISDILVTTDIVPNLLHILLNNGATITFIDCITQFYFLCASETFECLFLAVMSYDRYVAICNPLRYTSIMTNGYCLILTVICWLFGCSMILTYIITTTKLYFCRSNIIDHFFCDIIPLLELVCSDTFIVHLEIYSVGFPIVFIPTTIIVTSYTYIVVAVLRIPSSTGRQKAFSTCSSHLIVVSIFYWTMFSVYIVPNKGQTLTISKILSLLYTVFTPLVNPIIYSLRNKDIKKAIQLWNH